MRARVEGYGRKSEEKKRDLVTKRELPDESVEGAV